METVELNKSNVLKAYKNAKPEWKNFLADLFGKAILMRKNYDEIESFEDACEVTGDDPNNEKFHDGEPDVLALRKLKVITRAINPEGWEADWNNGQYKWRPWFYLNKPGFRFNGSFYVISSTGAVGGSRLVFADKQRSDYAGTKFLGLYEALID